MQDRYQSNRYICEEVARSLYHSGRNIANGFSSILVDYRVEYILIMQITQILCVFYNFFNWLTLG